MEFNKKIVLKHTFFFAILCGAMLVVCMPNIMSVHGKAYRPELLTPFSQYLNEAYLKDPSLYHADAPVILKLPFLWDLYGDHHIMGNLYRALKTGKNLSRMGYNDNRPDNSNPDTIPDPDYKSLYTSTFNNFAELTFGLIPKELRHIDTIEKELAAARYVTLMRYFMLSVHVFGYIFLFAAICYRLGGLTAWVVGCLILINPAPLMAAYCTPVFGMGIMIYFAYALWFYPTVLKEYSHQKYALFIIGLLLLLFPIVWLSYSNFIIQTWSLTIVFLVFLEWVDLFRRNLWLSVRDVGMGLCRVACVAIIPLLLLIPIFIVESHQVQEWCGASFLEVSLGRLKTVSTNYYSVLSLPLFLLEAGLRQLVIPVFSPILYDPKLLLFIPRFFYTTSFALLIAITLVVYVYAYKKLRIVLEKKQLFKIIGVGVSGLFLWAIVYSITFPRLIVHHHMFGYAFNQYFALAFGVIIGVCITEIRRSRQELP